MSNLDVTDSEREETPNSSSTDAKKKPKGSMNRRNAKDVPEYEKQRLSRIAENKKRMEALGLAKLATSFLDSSMDLRKIDRKGSGSWVRLPTKIISLAMILQVLKMMTRRRRMKILEVGKFLVLVE